jgi:hypothetical protein
MRDWQLTESLRGVFIWLQSLSPGSASFLGSFTGASIGLFVLFIGALFNARLSRRRDDRLRRIEARAAATALSAELTGINQALMQNTVSMETQRPPLGGGYYVPDLSQGIRAYPHILPRIGLFDSETIQVVLVAYAVVEQHCEVLAAWGGTQAANAPIGRRAIYMPVQYAEHLRTIHNKTSEYVQAAITRLDLFLRRNI